MLKISCLQESLAKGLATVGRGVATRSTLPITECVLLRTEGDVVRMTATNLECEVTTTVGAIIEEHGEVAIPYRRFADLIGSLPATKVQIDLLSAEEADGGEAPEDAVGTIARITCDRSVTHLNAAAASDFPPSKQINDGAAVKIDPASFKAAVSMTQFSTSKKDARVALHGLLIRFDEGTMTVVGADGFRLSVHTHALQHQFEERVDLITPLRTMQDVHRLAGDQAGPIEMTVAEDQGSVRFKMEEGTMTSQLIKAQYPDYTALVPQNWGTSATLDVEDLRSAVQTANVFAKDSSKIIRMEMDPKSNGSKAGRMRLSARSEKAGDNTREIDIELLDGDGRIAFNSDYLQEICNAVGKGKIKFEMTNDTSPGVVRYADNDSYVHVMMPMRVEWGRNAAQENNEAGQAEDDAQAPAAATDESPEGTEPGGDEEATEPQQETVDHDGGDPDEADNGDRESEEAAAVAD